MNRRRPPEVYFLVLLLLLTGLNAVVAGAGLFLFPDGQWIGLPLSWLEGSPFPSFRIPGLLLFLFNGVLVLTTCAGLLFQPAWKWTQRLAVYKDKFWAWSFSLYSGLGLCIWIIVQQLMTNYFILQPIVAAVGVGTVILTLLPRVSNYYQIKPRP